MCAGIVIVVDFVLLEAVLLKHDSILNLSCDHTEVTSPVTIVDYRPTSYATAPHPPPVCLILCLRKVTVHLGYGTVVFQVSWTSFPTPFVSAQRLSERAVLHLK
jgi:hypothetical protein